MVDRCDPSHQNRALVSLMHFKMILVHLCGGKEKKLRSIFDHKIAMQ